MNKVLVISRDWLTPKTEFSDENRFEVGLDGVINIVKYDEFQCFQVEYESGEVIWVTNVNYVRWGAEEKMTEQNA